MLQMNGETFIFRKKIPNVNLKSSPYPAFHSCCRIPEANFTFIFCSWSICVLERSRMPNIQLSGHFLKIMEHFQLLNKQFYSKHAVVHWIKVTEFVTSPFSYLCYHERTWRLHMRVLRGWQLENKPRWKTCDQHWFYFGFLGVSWGVWAREKVWLINLALISQQFRVLHFLSETTV